MVGFQGLMALWFADLRAIAGLGPGLVGSGWIF
jgi:hypothetical protein